MESCTICGRPRNEVATLLTIKTDRFLCGRCLELASVLMGKAPVKDRSDVTLKTPQEIRVALDSYVISQEEAKLDIAVAVYSHYKRREVQRKALSLGVEIQKSNILLMGPSGTGKTQIARAVAKLLDVPFYVGDATKLTSAGYVGDDVESLLQGLLADCDYDLDRAAWGIIFLDEFDKLARKSGRGASGYRDVSGEGVQQALLKMLEGSKVRVPSGDGRQILVDTTNILFICAGSFAGIDETVRQRINKKARMGFGAESRKTITESDIYTSVTEEDILEFGIIPELLGRIPVHTTTLPLSEDDMVKILTEPKDALVKQFQALFGLDNVTLNFSPDALRAIGQEASSRPTGARALRSILTRILKPLLYSTPQDPTITEIHITESVVTGLAEAVIVREAFKVSA